MPKATNADKRRVIEIITEAFVNNPSVDSVVKKGNMRNRRIAELARYAFNTAIVRNGVFLSKDGESTAICYRYNAKKEGWSDYLNQARLVLRCSGFRRLPEILKREAYIKKQRPEDGDFLYFWFFGASNKGKGQGAARQLKEEIFEESEKLGIPIYLETSVEKNKRVYQRYGFEIYHSWQQHCTDFTLWFMRRSNHS